MQVSQVSVSVGNVSSVVNTTLVFGVPLDNENDDMCILSDDHSSWGFSKTFNAPVWVATIIYNISVCKQVFEDIVVEQM